MRKIKIENYLNYILKKKNSVKSFFLIEIIWTTEEEY